MLRERYVGVRDDECIAKCNDKILVTGSSGFIGSRVVEILLGYGFDNLRCFVRPSSNLASFNRVVASHKSSNIEVIAGDLRSPDDCTEATQGVSLVYHLAAGIGEKSIDAAYLSTVVTTKNLLEALLKSDNLKRFVSVSSFSVYSTEKIRSGALLDETCEMEKQPERRGDPYCYAKVKQDELVMDYGTKHKLPYVIVRPGAVYGPGKREITGRVGIFRLGILLHLGGSNAIPFTYVDNCADAIVLAGLRKGVEGEVFNIVDDKLPTSREFLKIYEKNVRHLRSVYLPKKVSYFLCYLWEKCSSWSGGRLSATLNRKRWSSDWKGNQYSNEKLKSLLGWKPRIPLEEGLKRYFEYCKNAEIIDG